MPAPELELLTDAALQAAKIATGHWRADPPTWDKGAGAGPVTQADLEVDTYLRERLLAARPDCGWLSEETPDGPARLSHRSVFIVDPIDGTRSFVAGERTWALSLALVEDGRPVAGVVYLPLRDKLFAATPAGATLNGAPIRASRRPGLTGANVLAARPTFEPHHWPGGAPEVTRHFRASLAYRLCCVAEGRFDAMLTLRDAWEWDIAAGALIAEAAGARITDRKGKPLRFNTPGAQLDGVVVGSSAVHAQLIERLTEAA